MSLGLGAGTTGGSVEAAVNLGPRVVFRAQGAFFDFNAGFNTSDVHYEGRLKFNTGGAYLDAHPFANPWLISGGAVAGDRKVNVTGSPTVSGSVTIRGVTYTTSQIAQVNGFIDYGNLRPFAGIGWDNTYYARHKLGFRFLAGVVFGADPNVQLRAVGPLANDPNVLSALATEAADLKRQAGDYRYYPIAQAGVTYRF